MDKITRLEVQKNKIEEELEVLKRKKAEADESKVLSFQKKVSRIFWGLVDVNDNDGILRQELERRDSLVDEIVSKQGDSPKNFDLSLWCCNSDYRIDDEIIYAEKLVNAMNNYVIVLKEFKKEVLKLSKGSRLK